MKGQGNLKVLNLEVTANNTALPIPVTTLEGTWAKNQLAHDLKLKIFDGNLRVKGQLKLNKTRKGELDPVIDSKVYVNPVFLARLKPLVGQTWFPDKGKVDGVVHLQGPILRSKTITAEGRLRVQNTAIPLKDGNIKLTRIVAKGLWSENHFSHKILMKVFGGTVTVQGNLNLKNNDKGELEPIIDSEITPQSISLTNLRPLIQQDWFPINGILSGKVHMRGPVKRFSEIKIKGILAGKKVALKIKDKLIVFENMAASFKPEVQNNMLINFDLNDISVGEFHLRKSTGKMIYSTTAIELKQGRVWPKTGALLLKGDYKFTTKDYKLEFSGKKLRLEDFRKENLEGPLSFRGSFYGRVLPENPKKGLSGSFKINSENGKILKSGSVLMKILDALNLNLLGRDEKKLHYRSLGGNGNIKNGILFTKNFKLDSPSLKIFVSGKADLTDERVNAEVVAIPLGVTDAVLNSLNTLAAKSQLENSNKGMISKTINKIPLIGDTLAGSTEEEQGILDGILKIIPLLGDKRKEFEQPASLIKVYFSVDGTFRKPNVYFLPKKTSLF